MLLFGRILFGISTGLFNTIGPKFNKENVPDSLYDQIFIISLSFAGFGSLIAFLSGELLPPNKNAAELYSDENWKIIFVYFPMGIYSIVLFSLFFVIKSEPIKFLIGKN